MTFASLCLRVASAVKDRPELDRVPLPVIASCIEEGMRHFADYCPSSLGDFAEIEAMDLEPCETCGNFIDPAKLDGAVSDPESGYFCAACAVEMAEAEGAEHGSPFDTCEEARGEV